MPSTEAQAYLTYGEHRRRRLSRGMCCYEKVLVFAVGYPTLRQIVRCQFNLDAVARHETDIVLAHPASDVSYNYMAVFKLDSKLRSRQSLNDGADQFDYLFFTSHKYNLNILTD